MFVRLVLIAAGTPTPITLSRDLGTTALVVVRVVIPQVQSLSTIGLVIVVAMFLVATSFVVMLVATFFVMLVATALFVVAFTTTHPATVTAQFLAAIRLVASPVAAGCVVPAFRLTTSTITSPGGIGVTR